MRLTLQTYFRFNRTVRTTTSYRTCEAGKGSLTFRIAIMLNNSNTMGYTEYYESLFSLLLTTSVFWVFQLYLSLSSYLLLLLRLELLLLFLFTKRIARRRMILWKRAAPRTVTLPEFGSSRKGSVTSMILLKDSFLISIISFFFKSKIFRKTSLPFELDSFWYIPFFPLETIFCA